MKWIKCSDQMPEDCQDLIAYGLFYEDIWGVEQCRYTEGCWRIENGCCRDNWNFEKVTHWMPLPEKPKEDK